MSTVTVKRVKSAAAFTLVEIMLSVAVLLVAVIGASGYRCYAGLDARKAKTHITAARIALLLSESWRGVKGSETYDPVLHLSPDLSITANTMYQFDSTSYVIIGSAAAEGFTPLGIYTVVSNNANDVYYATLSYKDVSTGLRALNVVVAWPQAGQRAPTTSVSKTTGATVGYKLFKLTTYTEN